LIGRLVEFGRFIDFAFRSLLAMPGSLLRQPGVTIRQFERVAWGSLPLVFVAGVSVGLVTWLQTRRLLVVYGIEAALPSVLTAAVFVETGPILASLLVAGRMGAGLAAELASMTLTEEVDAREILGAPVIPTLVAPRATACAVAVPLLTVIIDVAAFLGGLVAELSAGTLGAQVFSARSLDFLRLSDIVPATLKTALFGFLIAIVGCWTGLRADRSTEAVGNAATRGVVRAMLVVFLADVLTVPWIQVVVEAAGWMG
jgi:phospholipid/cholesterol/gamma-HCH transport system permease protein